MMSSGFGLDSAEKIGHNEDMLTEIFVNLPTKSLIKFKIVSKQWLSIISSTNLCVTHTRSLFFKGSPKPSALFLGDIHFSASGFRFLSLTRDCVRLPCLDFITGVPKIKLVQSCNGLLLCYDSSCAKGYFICNPITRKFKMCPIPISGPRDYPDYRLIGVSLAFDPLKSPHHKIITVWGQKIWHMAVERPYFIDIYSSETNSWLSSKIKYTSNGGVNFEFGVFFKGSIHWDSKLLDTLESPYLDVENECLKMMRMPTVQYVGDRYFGESGGYLNLAVAHSPPVYIFSIFAMVEDYSYWDLKYTLDYNIFSPKYFLEPFQLFCAVESAEGDSIYIVCRDGSGVSYNFKYCRIKELHHCPSSQSHHLYDCFRGCQYIETLSCVF